MKRFEGGGTQMTDGILHSLDMPGDPEAMRLILMLTDGYIGNERHIVEVVDDNLGDARIFSLGMGSSVNRLLLENLAEIGRGSAAYQLPNTPRKETVAAFYDRIAHPAMTDITIDWGDLEVFETYPTRIPDLWAGEPLRVVARYRGRQTADDVVITGEVDGELYTLRRPVDLAEAEENEAVSTLWARRKIHDIRYDLDLHGPDREAAITPLALEHHLVSDFTSLVAVETQPSTCGAPTTTVDVAHYAPDGTRGDVTPSRHAPASAPAVAYAPPAADPAPMAPRPRPRPRPKPSPAYRPAPAPAPMVAPEPSPEPEPEPMVAHRFTVKTPTVTGDLDASAIQRAVKALALTTERAARARVNLVVVDGKVTEVRIQGIDAGVAASIERRLLRMSLSGSGTAVFVLET